MHVPASSVLFACFVALSSVDGISSKPRQLLLVSFDGFRYDYVTRYNAVAFKKLAEKGVSAVDGYYPAFPSSTFPCHYTLVTGLHPESHGIVYNRMYDPMFNETFTLANTETKWFDGGEPLWITARLNHLKSACFFWPGSQTVIRNTTANMYKGYNKTIPFEERINGVVEWLANEDVSFATLYFEQPDQAGHQFGPLTPQVEQMVQKMDQTLQYLLDKIAEAKLTDKLNLIVTSDHGMGTVVRDDEHVMYLEEVLNDTDYDQIPQTGSVSAIWPKPGKTDEVYETLIRHGHPNITIYRKENIPERFHYSKHRRIMPIVLIGDEGFLTLQNRTQLTYYGPGQHGYDNRLPAMRPVFIASGPDFRQNVKAAEPFESVNVYPLMCHLLGIEPRPNNGSLDVLRWMLAESTSAASAIKSNMVFLITVLTVFSLSNKIDLTIL